MNKQFAIILLLTIFSLSSKVKSQSSISDNKIKKNQVYLLGGAPSLYSGFSYERIVFNKSDFTILPRTGFGINIFIPSFGKEFNINFGITMLYGKIHKLEIGFGTIHYLLSQADISKQTNYFEYKFLIYGLIGYRYYFRRNPLSLKIGFTPVIVANPDKWTLFPMAEIGVGFRM
ncbi:MAG: hypothetical protein NTV01_22390 [Bacteroidia bacterium]|nr:hypothetical protein [Bacteroidia bacterium]